MKEQVLTRFKELFGDEGDIRVYFAPGRVNLIESIRITTEVMYFHAH